VTRALKKIIHFYINTTDPLYQSHGYPIIYSHPLITSRITNIHVYPCQLQTKLIQTPILWKMNAR